MRGTCPRSGRGFPIALRPRVRSSTPGRSAPSTATGCRARRRRTRRCCWCRRWPRRRAGLTDGRVVTALYQALGGAPAPLVSLGFQLTALDKRITKPLTVLRNLHDREMLAHIEAVDDYMAHMLAYPGRTFAQLYHRFFRVNDLADGRIELGEGEVIDVSHVHVPVLVVAGSTDVLAPRDAVYHVVDLLAGSPDVRTLTAK